MTAIDKILAVAAQEATSDCTLVSIVDPCQTVGVLEILSQARALAGQRNYLEAEQLCLEAVVASEKLFGKASPIYGFCLEDLGVVRICQGKRRQADITLTEAHDVLEAALGATHPDVLRVSGRLQELYHS